jgi:histone acetyltransferase 1
MTLYEAYQNAEKMRMKISQVLVMPPFQRQGIASALYRMVYDMYRLNNEKCVEIIVEDAADDFQRIQDIVNSEVLLKTFTQYQRTIPNVIQTPAQVLWM